jgi:hypothetical protein
MKVRVVSAFQTSHHNAKDELVVVHHVVGTDIELPEHVAIEELHRNRVVTLEPAAVPEVAAPAAPAAESAAAPVTELVAEPAAEPTGELGEPNAAE